MAGVVPAEVLMLTKAEGEHPVPVEWRPVFVKIVDAFLAGDFALSQHSVGVRTIVEPETALSIPDQIADYGDRLVPLNDAVWKRSVYMWGDITKRWEFIVDLSTEQQIVSDLIIHAKLYERGEFVLEIHSVYVP